MPFAGFKDWNACTIAQKEKGHGEVSANKICGAIKARVEGKTEELSSFGEFITLTSKEMEEVCLECAEGMRKNKVDKITLPVNILKQYIDSFAEDKTSPKDLQEKKVEEFAETFDLDNVEVFKAGTWNGDTYSEADIQTMVDNFVDLKDKVKPPVKLGHNEDQKIVKDSGLPAGGWIKSLKKVGKKLVADISDVPRKIYELVKNKGYKRVSSEVYPNYKSAGKEHGPALRAVAFLGSDIPAVDGLSDILALHSSYEEDGQEIKVYSVEDKEKVKFTIKTW